MSKQSDMRVHSAQIPNLVSLAPVPCRMLQVKVFENEPGEGARFSVSWSEVVGLLCLIETEYAKRTTEGDDCPQPGMTDDDMTRLGWRADGLANQHPHVWPVLVGNNGEGEYPIRVAHERDADSNARYSTVVRANWSEDFDRDMAIQIGKELVKNKGSRVNWADLPDEPSA